MNMITHITLFIMPTQAEDQVLYIAKLHPIIYFWPLMFIAFALGLAIAFPTFAPLPYILLAVGLIWLVYTWVHWSYTSLIIQSQHITLKTGFFTRAIVDIPMAKIERVDVRQTIIGAYFRYGSLHITGTGGSQMGIHELKDPLTPRRYIEQVLAHIKT